MLFQNREAISWAMFACLAIVLLVILMSPYFAFAQIPKRLVPCDGVDCNVCHIAQLAQNALNLGIYIAVFLSAVLFAYAGWLYMTAGGESGVEKGKEIFLNVAIGLSLILASWLIVDLIMKALVNESALRGPWNAICP